MTYEEAFQKICKLVLPIRNEDDYKAALSELSAFFDSEPEPGSAEGDRFEVMLTLVEAYEQKRFQPESPDPVEAIRDHDELHGHAVVYPDKLSEVLSDVNPEWWDLKEEDGTKDS